MGKEFLNSGTEVRFTFCTGIAVLLVTFPPNIDAWLAGEIGEYQMTVWIAGVAAILRGLLVAVFAVAGVANPFKAAKKVENHEEVSKAQPKK